MTQTRETKSINKEKKSPDLGHEIGSAAVTTLIVQPLRVFLNRASFHQSPVSLVKEVVPNFSQGLPNLIKGTRINLFRGTLAMSSQAYAKKMGDMYFGFKTGL